MHTIGDTTPLYSPENLSSLMIVDTALNVPLYRPEVFGSWKRTLTVDAKVSVNIFMGGKQRWRAYRCRKVVRRSMQPFLDEVHAYIARNEFFRARKPSLVQDVRTRDSSGEEVEPRIYDSCERARNQYAGAQHDRMYAL